MTHRELRVSRRRLLAAAGAVLFAPCTVRAQAPGALPRIAYLGGSTRASQVPLTAAWLAGLRERGWVDGENLKIDYLWADGQLDRLARLSEEVAKSGYTVIFASGLTSARAVRAHTATVPIVSALLHDPVAEGFATSWSRPGGNVTGTSTLNHELLAKRVQILRELVPQLQRFAVVYEPALSNLKHGIEEIAATAARMGIQATGLEMRREADIEAVFERIQRQRMQAVIVPAYPLTSSNIGPVASAALRRKLPALGEVAEFAQRGGLASHGPDWGTLFRRSATHVDRILRGALPGDLPIEQPTHYELLLNQKTASSLGLRLPQAVVLRADRVIE